MDFEEQIARIIEPEQWVLKDKLFEQKGLTMSSRLIKESLAAAKRLIASGLIDMREKTPEPTPTQYQMPQREKDRLEHLRSVRVAKRRTPGGNCYDEFNSYQEAMDWFQIHVNCGAINSVDSLDVRRMQIGPNSKVAVWRVSHSNFKLE